MPGFQKTRSTLIAAAALAIAGQFGSAGPSLAQSGPSFFEDFSQPLSQKRWLISDGWTNGAHQNCVWSRDHVGLSNGVLTLRMTSRARKDRAYSCAEIQTNDRFGYGTYEVKMKVPATSGLNSNFFSFIGDQQKQPHNEIDFEFLGKAPDTVQLNYFSGPTNMGGFLTPTPGATEGFQRFAFVWEPGRIRWYQGDTLLLDKSDTTVPSLPQKIFLSLWGTDTLTAWMGPFVYPGHPLDLAVDWVSYTALGDKCQNERSIVCDPAFGK